ncbi:20748_t:CDS:2, partial [Dentiscutata erythropus]
AKRPLQLTEVNTNAVDENQAILEELAENYTDEDSYSDEENNILIPENVQNPTRVIGRGRPPKSRFKSSVEKKQNRQKASREPEINDNSDERDSKLDNTNYERIPDNIYKQRKNAEWTTPMAKETQQHQR